MSATTLAGHGRCGRCFTTGSTWPSREGLLRGIRGRQSAPGLAVRPFLRRTTSSGWTTTIRPRGGGAAGAEPHRLHPQISALVLIAIPETPILAAASQATISLACRPVDVSICPTTLPTACSEPLPRRRTAVRRADRRASRSAFHVADFAKSAAISGWCRAWRGCIVGVDRLDYTKGLPRRFGVRPMLEREPELTSQVHMIQIAVPTREEDRGLRRSRAARSSRWRPSTAARRPTGRPIQSLYQCAQRRAARALYRSAAHGWSRRCATA